MSISLPTYSTREEVQRALDMTPAQVDYLRIDRANEAARDAIEGLCHRRFYNVQETHYWDWPNFQRAYPWRIWLDEAELADVTGNVPVITSGGTVIPSSDVFYRPWNYSPPFYAIELDRSTNASFGVGNTPQRDVSVTGTFGYWAKTATAGTITADINASVTAIAVSSAVSPGVGDVMIMGTEWMLVTDRAFADTTQTQSSGCTTAVASDNTLTVSGGTFYPGEVLLLDSEQMLVQTVAGSVLTVKRGYPNGTVLATHTSASIYAGRSLTVVRGTGGTTAASHTNGDAITISLVPSEVKALSVAEAVNTLLQETTGYAKVVGETGAAQPATGGSLPDLRNQVLTRYGRHARIRVI